MKINAKISVLVLFMSMNIGAMDSVQTTGESEATIDLTEKSPLEKDITQGQEAKSGEQQGGGCATAMQCQLGKFIAIKYNNNVADEAKVYVMPKDEVQDEYLYAELQNLAKVIKVRYENDQPVQHKITSKGNRVLDLKDKCPDFMLAQGIIAEYEQLKNKNMSLVDTFNHLKMLQEGFKKYEQMEGSELDDAISLGGHFNCLNIEDSLKSMHPLKIMQLGKICGLCTLEEEGNHEN